MSLQSRTGWLLEGVGTEGLFDWKDQVAHALKGRLDQAQAHASRVKAFRFLFVEQVAGRNPSEVDVAMAVLTETPIQATVQVYRHGDRFLAHPVGDEVGVGHASEALAATGASPYGYNGTLDAELAGVTPEEWQHRAESWSQAFQDPSPLSFTVTAAPSFDLDTSALPVSGVLAYSLSILLDEGLSGSEAKAALRTALVTIAPLFEGRMDLLNDPIDEEGRSRILDHLGLS